MYEQKHIPAVPLLPDIHPLVDPLYAPYDIGQMGQLDVHILTELFGGDAAARDLTPAWDGGLYWAGQLRSATTPAEQDSTKSLALFISRSGRTPTPPRSSPSSTPTISAANTPAFKLYRFPAPRLRQTALRNRSSPPTKARW